MRGRRGRELGYIAGRTLTMMRPCHLIRLARPGGADLRAVFDGALALAGARDGDRAERTGLDLVVTESSRERLAEAVDRAGGAAASALDPIAWGTGAELTAQRVGFVLAGDLATAARAITRDAVPERGAGLAARIDQLLAYAISDDYFEVRAYLGTTIDQIHRAAQHLEPAA